MDQNHVLFEAFLGQVQAHVTIMYIDGARNYSPLHRQEMNKSPGKRRKSLTI